MKTFVFMMLLILTYSCIHAVAENKEIQKKSNPKSSAIGKISTTQPPVVINLDINNKDSWVSKLWSDPIATFTGLLFLATFFLIVVGVVEWLHNRDTAKKELRAYVAIDDAGFQASAGVPQPKLFIRNYGKTPANRVSLYRRILESAPPDLNTYPIDDSSLFLWENVMVHPNQKLNQFISSTPLHDIAVVHNKFIYGYLDYSDIYGGRWRYKFAYRNRGNDWFTPHPTHNEEINLSESFASRSFSALMKCLRCKARA